MASPSYSKGQTSLIWLPGPGRFGTLALFERCLLLLNALVLPNSSTHVATLYLGPMGSLWAYIEGMDGLYLCIMGANGSDLAAWARFGTLALSDGRLLPQNFLDAPEFF